MDITIKIKQPEINKIIYGERINCIDIDEKFKEKLYKELRNKEYERMYSAVVEAKTTIEGKLYSTGFEYDWYDQDEELRKNIKYMYDAIKKTYRNRDRINSMFKRKSYCTNIYI